jgi:glycosyltransferase involved in cell wall biosynthesis
VRIALIAPPWIPVPPAAYGGTEAVLDTLARGLAAAGHDVLLCASGDSTCPVERRATVPTALGTDAMTPAAELAHAVRAYAAATSWGADIIHDHTLIGPLLADRCPVPVLTTNHGTFGDDLHDCYRAISSRVPLLAISEHHASTRGRCAVEAVIHHGVELERFPVGAGGGGAVFVGRMSPTKGVHLAIEVARGAAVPLRIAAKLREPLEREYFEASVRPLLGGEVEYLGELGTAEKCELLGQADCLLNPIQWAEPFGMVMIEALACGTPVVATPFGSVTEIVDDGVTGYVRRDVPSLAAAVPAAAALSRAACRQAAASRFSAARMVGEHVSVYRRLASAPEHRPISLPPAPPQALAAEPRTTSAA